MILAVVHTRHLGKCSILVIWRKNSFLVKSSSDHPRLFGQYLYLILCILVKVSGSKYQSTSVRQVMHQHPSQVASLQREYSSNIDSFLIH